MRRTFTLQLRARLTRCSSRYRVGTAGGSVVRCELDDGHFRSHYFSRNNLTRYNWDTANEMISGHNGSRVPFVPVKYKDKMMDLLGKLGVKDREAALAKIEDSL